MDDATAQASKATSLADGQLAQIVGAWLTLPADAERCTVVRARAIARHYRCEARAVAREGVGRDASRLRARCAKRLESTFAQSASRYVGACVGDASTVAVANVAVAANVEAGDELVSADRAFETADFPLGEGCNLLARAHCLVPWPSMAFFEAVPGETNTGFRMKLPNPIPLTMNGDPLWSDPFDGFDGVIAGDDPFTSRVLEKGQRLKVIARWGVGMDAVDLAAAERLGIRVLNTPDALSDEVADVAMGYILLLARQLHRLDRSVQGGGWPKIQGMSLSGKTLGIKYSPKGEYESIPAPRRT